MAFGLVLVVLCGGFLWCIKGSGNPAHEQPAVVFGFGFAAGVMLCVLSLAVLAWRHFP